MPGFWVKDEEGRVLGPVSLKVLQELSVQGRLQGFILGSRDGNRWLPLYEISEVFDVLMPPGLAERHARDRQEAQRIRLLIDRYQEMRPHELFGVPESAELTVYRQGFVQLARPFRPGSLPGNSHPELLAACNEMFQFLSRQMTALEQSRSKAPEPARASPTPGRGAS